MPGNIDKIRKARRAFGENGATASSGSAGAHSLYGGQKAVGTDESGMAGAEALFDFSEATERRIIEAVDLEKQRFANELHENLCQFLVGISLLGNALNEELARLNLNQAQDARQITRLAKDAVLQVRGLVKQLSPMPLGHGEGLVSALEDLAEQAAAGSKIKCSFQTTPGAHRMEPTIAIHLYRIAQEAVHNAIKHAKATRLSIRFSVCRHKMVLTVRDNGIGFVPQQDRSSGIGLQLMSSRARAIQAKLEFRKLPVRGTAVICTLLTKRQLASLR